MAAVGRAKAERLRRLAERWIEERGGPPPGRRPHRPGRRADARDAAPPWSSTRGGWPDGIRAYVLRGPGRRRGRGRRGAGRSGARGRGVHAGRAAGQEPDGEPGPGQGRGGQLRRRVAAEEAHGRAEPRVGAQGRQRIRSRGRLRRARGGRADRPAGPRRHRDDRRAGARRPGATGPRRAARRPRGGRRRLRTGGRPGVHGRRRPRWCPGVSVLGVRSLRQLIAVLDRRAGAGGGAATSRGGPIRCSPGSVCPAPACGTGLRGGLRRRPRAWTSPMSSARRRPARPWRSRRREGTTSSCKGRRAPARRCSRSGCPRSCPG